jgi:hypothetical protein
MLSQIKNKETRSKCCLVSPKNSSYPLKTQIQNGLRYSWRRSWTLNMDGMGIPFIDTPATPAPQQANQTPQLQAFHSNQAE